MSKEISPETIAKLMSIPEAREKGGKFTVDGKEYEVIKHGPPICTSPLDVFSKSREDEH